MGQIPFLAFYSCPWPPVFPILHSFFISLSLIAPEPSPGNPNFWNSRDLGRKPSKCFLLPALQLPPLQSRLRLRYLAKPSWEINKT